MKILIKLPEHLDKYSDNHDPKPMTGTAFRAAGEWWHDPASDLMFWANGRGYFESGAFGISEHPNLKKILEQWNTLPEPHKIPVSKGGTMCGVSELKDLFDFVEELAPPADPKIPNLKPRFLWSTALEKVLAEQGVTYLTERKSLVSGGWPETFYINVKGFTVDIEKEMRRRFVIRHQAYALIAKKPKDMGAIDYMKEQQTLSERWEVCVTKFRNAGLEGKRCQDLLKRICEDLQIQYSLNSNTCQRLEAAVEAELALVNVQKENSPPGEELPPTLDEADEVLEGAVVSEEGNEQAEPLPSPSEAAPQPITSTPQTASPTTQSDQPPQSSATPSAKTEEQEQALNQVFDSQTQEEADKSVEKLKEADAKAKKGGSKKSTKSVPKAEPPSDEWMYAEDVVNQKTGKVKKFKTVLAHIKWIKDNIKWRKDDNKRNALLVKGKFFCYWQGLYDIVHAQFMKQYSKETKTFFPNFVDTPAGKFKHEPEPNGGPTLTDSLKYKEWLDAMTEEEAQGLNGAVEMKWVVNEVKLHAIIADGFDVPGWENKPEDPAHDPVGRIWLEGGADWSKVLVDTEEALAKLDGKEVEEESEDEDEEEAA